MKEKKPSLSRKEALLLLEMDLPGKLFCLTTFPSMGKGVGVPFFPCCPWEESSWKEEQTRRREGLKRKDRKDSPFGMLQKRNQNLEMTFSPEEEKILLSAYEKNTLRIFYFLCQHPSFAWQIQRCFFFLGERLDSDSMNFFLQRMKQWMNIEIFQSHYGYHEMERFVFDPSLHQLDALELVEKEYLEKWKGKDNPEKIKMNSLGLPPPLLYVFRRLLQSFFLYHHMDGHQSVGSSFPLQFFQRQILSEILAQFKILHMTESWVTQTLCFQKEFLALQKDLFGNVSSPKRTSSRVEHLSIPLETNLSLGHPVWNSFLVRIAFEQGYHLLLKDRMLGIVRPSKGWSSWFPEGESLVAKEILWTGWIRQEWKKQMERVEQVEWILKISKSLKHTIAQDHIRLVMSVAKHHKYRNMDMSDLLQEGLLGLTKAVERFELERGYQFTTYATWWVHQALNRVTLNGNQMIPIPTHLQRKIQMILMTSTQLSKELSREPSVEEIADRLNVSVQKVTQSLQTSLFSNRLMSLDQKFSHENRSYLHFLRTPEKLGWKKTKPDGEMFETLSPKMATFFQMVYGIPPFERHSVEEVAMFFGLSKKRAHLLYTKGLRGLQQQE